MSVITNRVEREAQLATLDPVWARIRAEAQDASLVEPALSAFLLDSILSHNTLEAAVGHRVASRLDHEAVGSHIIAHAFAEAIADQPDIAEAVRADIAAVLDRDPACHRALEPVLYFKGFHAIQSHRLAHWLWASGRRDFALYLQSRASSVFGVDIHPAARIGRGIMFDHATGIVVGETATIGDNVSMLHGVTLGGNGKEEGDRHPKVQRGVLIGAGAKILGNLSIGCCSRVAAGSVVLSDVPADTTVAGVPARVVGKAGCSEPARSMNHLIEGQSPDR
ncbi:serine O-acetyltransferase [Lutibaculum baratangense]|uniref:Serine acetyltransferase n=1 Tax=Lutibaculum baratangense AMV1 TaxID=631454 RepID=V4RII3_9HYPH|nr:serine O-acetyltransferase [Lutibaculum baratangense]ESR25149.1 Serine acetyltransferase [Lutibaculum baratangense AMV1]